MEKAKAVVMSDEMIDFFVNAVFVYDDRVTITFNYSGDNRTITLPEVDPSAQAVRSMKKPPVETGGFFVRRSSAMSAL